VFSAQKTPPPTYFAPETRRPAPIIITVAPVTTGGKSFFMMCGGMKAMPTSMSEATRTVPRKSPYP